MIEDDPLAGDDVGGDGAERDGEIVEVLDLRHRQCQAAQYLRELLPLHQSARQAETPALQPQREFDQEVLVLELAAEIQVLARRPVAERVLPVHRSHDALDVGGREARGVQPADHRAHAGAGDGIDRHVILFEHFEHADVRRASRAAAREHQPDPGTSGLALARGFLRRRSVDVP